MSAPKRFSAYYVTWSDEPSMPVGGVLIDKGDLLERDWNVMNFATGVETGAIGARIARLCPTCRVKHGRIGVLDHSGECGSDEVRDKAAQLLKDLTRERESA